MLRLNPPLNQVWCIGANIQIQPMLRLNDRHGYTPILKQSVIQIQPMLRLNPLTRCLRYAISSYSNTTNVKVK